MVVKAPSYFLFFRLNVWQVHRGKQHTRYMGSFVDLCWNCRVCGRYEVDVSLLCSTHPCCFVALFLPLLGVIGPIWRLWAAMGTTGCAKSLLNYHSYI